MLTNYLSTSFFRSILVVSLFLLAGAITCAAQVCGVYVEVDEQWDNNTAVVDNVTDATCVQAETYAEAHITLPSGRHADASGSGAEYAEAVASIAINGETGQGTFSGYGEASLRCWEDSETDWPFSDSFPLNDPTPNIDGINPPTWDAGATTTVTISGSGFGTNPLLSITDPAGAITQVQITSSSDAQITALVTVADNAPPEAVTLTVTSQGYNGYGFTSNAGNSAKSPTASALINPIVVTLSLDACGGTKPCSDDDAQGAYYTDAHTQTLGSFVSYGYCSIGYEVAGKVLPKSYKGNVLLVRSVQGQDWIGINGQIPGLTFPSGTSDTSKPQYKDEDPYSGVSAGMVYDLDAPGVKPDPLVLWRRRVNFFENAQLPDGTYVASELPFFVRLSCLGNSTGNTFSADVPGDNVLGSGQTNTSWDLR